MTNLIVVRHAESRYNLEGRIQGHMDSELTPKGRRQAARLARRIFRHFKVNKIYSSDLGRAFTTTEAITRHIRQNSGRIRPHGSSAHYAVRRTRLPIVRDPLLREIHLGDWEGMTPEAVDRLYENGYKRWLKKPSICRIPKCEPISRFRRRIVRRVEAIARANRGKTVLIVTHGGAITSLLADWLGADFDHLLLNLQVDNTSLTIARLGGRRVRLMTINDASHLGPRER